MDHRQALESFFHFAHQWHGYKADLKSQRQLASAGFPVKQTSMAEFTERIDAAGMGAINALELSDAELIESIGEMFLNVSMRLKAKATGTVIPK